MHADFTCCIRIACRDMIDFDTGGIMDCFASGIIATCLHGNGFFFMDCFASRKAL